MTNLPVTGTFSITAVYGQQGKYWANGHKGIDFAAADRRIFSTCDGIVRVVAYDSVGWGQYVSIGDAAGRRHIFCHLEKGSVRVKAGDKVTRATMIGTMGATGNATGVHLHYQLQNGLTVLNPCDYLGVPNQCGQYRAKDYNLEESGMKFKDSKEIPEWAKDAVKKAVDKGWMLGDEDGKFRPNDPVTRAELAVVLARLK